jgi:HEAT repeat protein
MRPTFVSRAGLLASLVSSAGIISSGCAEPRRIPSGIAQSRISQEPPAAPDPIAISALRERALDLLAESAAGQDPQLRANALEAMSASPVRLVPLIAIALRDENAGVRSTAAVIVGKSNLRDLAAAVRPLLNDPSPFVRASAIYAMARTGAQVDRTPLAGLLLGDPSPRVRAHAAFLLGEMGDRSATGLLKEAARTPVPRAPAAEVRLMQVQIAEAMVKLGDEAQIESIRAALYPSRPEELEATALAVQVIGHLRDRGAIDELVYLTAVRDEMGSPMPAEVRLGAAASLARLGLRRGAFLADEFAEHRTPTLRAQAAHVYGEVGDPAHLPRLERMMADSDGLVRVSAAAAIVKIASGGAPQAGR